MEENKPIINVKRFSRSKKVESESIEEPVKKTRGRKGNKLMNMKDKGPNDLEKNVFNLMRENHRLKAENYKT